MLGQVLDGRYRVTRELENGEGGQGKTYLAEDTKRPNNPICAVKHLRPASCVDPNLSADARRQLWETAERLFYQEAEILGKLGNHDRIPQLLAYFVEAQEFFLVEQFIDGQPLSKELSSGSRWNESQVIQMLQEVLEILDFVHGNSVIHRDIKPDNIMRRSIDNKLVLVDFGAVKQIQASELFTDGGQVKSTMAIGTIGYMAPEQQLGHPGFNSDLYSLGVIAIQALTGITAFELRMRYVDRDTGEINWRNLVDTDDRLADILTKMVSFHLTDRFQSATEVLEALPGSSLYRLTRNGKNGREVIKPPPPPATVEYAGFWKRSVASLIDGVILLIPWCMIFFLLVGLACIDYCSDEQVGIVFWIAIIVNFFISGIYYAVTESSQTQATMGKMAMGIIVTDLEGKRISLGKASGRYIGKLISTLTLYIGFIMAAFTEKKQALHDQIADCLVVKKR